MHSGLLCLALSREQLFSTRQRKKTKKKTKKRISPEKSAQRLLGLSVILSWILKTRYQFEMWGEKFIFSAPAYASIGVISSK